MSAPAQQDQSRDEKRPLAGIEECQGSVDICQNAELIAELVDCLRYATEQLELWMPLEHQAATSPHAAALAKCRAAIARAESSR